MAFDLLGNLLSTWTNISF